MSFKCDVCSIAQPTGVAPNMVVTKVRMRHYNVNQSIIPGHETEEEVKACELCKEKMDTPDVTPADTVLSEDLPEWEGNDMADVNL